MYCTSKKAFQPFWTKGTKSLNEPSSYLPQLLALIQHQRPLDSCCQPVEFRHIWHAYMSRQVHTHEHVTAHLEIAPCATESRTKNATDLFFLNTEDIISSRYIFLSRTHEMQLVFFKREHVIFPPMKIFYFIHTLFILVCWTTFQRLSQEKPTGHNAAEDLLVSMSGEGGIRNKIVFWLKKKKRVLFVVV